MTQSSIASHPPDSNPNPERRVVTRLKYVIAHRSSSTALHLYAVHFLNYLVPALNIALLTRRLSPPSYGLLIIAQSLGMTVATLTEYGFRWTGSRAVAASATGEELGMLVSAISAAKLLIALASSILIPIALFFIPSTAGHSGLLAGGYLLGVITGLDLQWYFLGRERLRGYLTVDAAMRGLGFVLVLVLIRDDRDVSKVLPIQASCYLVVLIWATWLVANELKLVWPTKKAITEAMRDGGTLFLQQIARYATGGINVAVMGMVASPAQVGFFGCADKLVRYLSSLSAPITQIVYPKISSKLGKDGDEAAKHLAKLAGTVTLIVAVIASGLIFAVPQLMIRVLYGPKMLPSLPPLRVLAIFPVLSSVNTSLVYYWLLPKRMERVSLRVIILSGIVNVVSIAVFAKLWHQTGAAAAVVLTEAITLIGYLLALRWTGAKHHRSANFAVLVKETN